MPNEAPTAETADIDFAALLRTEQAGLQAQLKELGFADQGERTQLRLELRRLQPGDRRARRGRAAGGRAPRGPRRSRGCDGSASKAAPTAAARCAGSRSGRPGSRPCPLPDTASPTPPSTRCVRPEGPPQGGAVRWTADQERVVDRGRCPLRRGAGGAPQHHRAGDRHLLRRRAVHHSARDVARLRGKPLRRRHGQASGPTHPQPGGARGSRGHADRPGAHGAERHRGLRLGEAGPGERRPDCTARAIKASWSHSPDRPSTPFWPACSESPSWMSRARGSHRIGSPRRNGPRRPRCSFTRAWSTWDCSSST